MKKISFAVATALIMGALMIALSKNKSDVYAEPAIEPGIQIGSDACKNVSFKFTNNRSDKATVRIEQVKYIENKAGSRIQRTENVKSNDCKYGQTCTTTGDNLPDSLDRDLSDFQIVYRYLTKGSAANWSDLVQTPPRNADNPQCKNNRTYGPGEKGFSVP